MTTDARRTAPSTTRNRDPILAVLKRHLPRRGIVLEIASGTGEHVTHFAAALSDLAFQPSDPDADARASIDAWAARLGTGNVQLAIALDVRSMPWPVAAVDAVIAINMIHIAPWPATEGLMHGASGVLPAGGLLYLYGPYRRGGRHAAPSNEAFDRSLRLQDAEWGVRDLEAVAALAAKNGFAAPVIEEMPANNLSVLLRRI